MNTVCLKNMQMLLETIANTINKLDVIFTVEYDNLEQFIIRGLSSRFIIGEDWERGVMFPFGYESDYRQKHLSELQPLQEIRYTIPFEENIKRKAKQSFGITFGYLSDTEQNVIYFQLFDYSESSSIMTESFIEEIKNKVPQEWECGTVGENDIYVEFEIDNDFTIDKIKQCSKVFKEYVLQPSIDKLQ